MSSKRDLIIQAAKQTFLKQGFEATSMDELALVANVARRTIYNQFDSKEELFNAVIIDIWKNVKPYRPEQNDDAQHNPSKGLFNLGMAIANYWSPPIVRSFLKLVIVEGDRFPDLPRNFYRLGKEPMIQSIFDYLTQMKHSHLLKIDDIGLATQQFIGMINEPLIGLGLIILSDEPDMQRKEHVVQAAVQCFINGYQP
ncbi:MULTISPECIES: TetR/AcrR family transcriptional regulator [unclassified Acinetobacter]|uniref:TetR/AcrR family transcriptional regulator n=1 Tax=unclassified Acinetobacter TaxID=196816 RepID=UPI00190C1D9E|nr:MULTISPECIES: TetR/AcrR family transcriptional regulator [unclassified Acinetobacter]MBK0063560.1 TetR/AcrR family transcriptional regulator [Acinetobacter sp. S55]MBK0065369.1 TetR/AcrR family transcriptional regulator [Acinetobacter sp. S54]